MALSWKRHWIQANVLKQQRGFFYSTQNPHASFFSMTLIPRDAYLPAISGHHAKWYASTVGEECVSFYPLMSFLTLLCKVNGYLCLCPPEYSGVHCDVKSSGCIGNKCASGSTCVNTPSGHDCVCPIGYEGTFCETKSNVRWWHFLSRYFFGKILLWICP